MIRRREFLRLSSLVTGGVVVSTALTGCALSPKAPALARVRFDHGVASGDPETDAVLLWTRALPVAPGIDADVGWEVASDPGFSNVLRSGTATTGPERDYTVKVDVRELSPGQRVYYRFLGADGPSPTGRAGTLPTGDVASVKMAVVSCANYPAGYFHAYREIGERGDIDVTVHLGDYLYEYGMGGYATENAEALGRALPADNAGELLTLADYRRRYALYRGDPDLQAFHACAPCIAVWDDHEISNDAWRDGAQNHGPDEGDYTARKLAAVQAYYEWMPIRPPAGAGDLRIYRRFDFGDLLSLHMLDTRLIGRDRQIDYADYRDAEGGFDAASFRRDLGNPERSLLGAAQRDWLSTQLAESPCRWQVLGQQIQMTRMLLPAELPGLVFSRMAREKKLAGITGLAQLKAARDGGATLSERDLGRIATVLPYNLDAWDGYPAERERVFATARALGKPLVVLAGDTHNAWYAHLHDAAGNAVGVEFATHSISSPGALESLVGLPPEDVGPVTDAIRTLIDEVDYCNLHQRGYLVVTADRSAVTGEWVFLDTVHSRQYRVAGSHREVFAAQ